jgi:hypothetical protein
MKFDIKFLPHLIKFRKKKPLPLGGAGFGDVRGFKKTNPAKRTFKDYHGSFSGFDPSG